MKQDTLFIFFVFIGFALLAYYLPPLVLQGDNKVFLTVSTFLFAIFAGFFISRQGSRSTEIRTRISRFDGILSFVYRSFAHFDPSLQKKIGEIIQNHYQLILKNRAWNYHITHPSSTIMSINTAIDDSLGEGSLKTLQANTLNRVIAALLEGQVARKDMIALYYEKIPRIQWVIIYLLSIVVLFSLATIPSYHLITESLLKAMFATAVACVVVLLSLLDDLRLFEEVIGENSAKDVLGIVTDALSR